MPNLPTRICLFHLALAAACMPVAPLNAADSYAGKTVELNAKSFHIMFLDVKSAPVAGTEFGGTLTFEKAGTLKVDFEVDEPE